MPDSRFSASWCDSVGHKMNPVSAWCLNCGLSEQQICEQAFCKHGRQVTPEGEYGVTYCLDCGKRGELQHG